jgi:hypothetical protein
MGFIINTSYLLPSGLNVAGLIATVGGSYTIEKRNGVYELKSFLLLFADRDKKCVYQIPVSYAVIDLSMNLFQVLYANIKNEFAFADTTNN